jgi:hypothetical protein
MEDVMVEDEDEVVVAPLLATATATILQEAVTVSEPAVLLYQ